MRKKILLLAVMAVAMMTMIASCKKSGGEEGEEKPTYTYSNDTKDKEVRALLDAMLVNNLSENEILYKLVFPLKVNNSGTRYRVIDSEAIDSKGNLTGKNTETEKVTVEVKYKGEYYYFQLTVPSGTDKDKAFLNMAASELLHNIDNVRGNISLVESLKTYKGVSVSWTSSDVSVITDTATGENGEIPAGVVTRGEQDVKVKLTAELTLRDQKLTKEYEVTVKAKPEALAERTKYLYAYFRGNIYGNGESQKIHMSTSEDGFFWSPLNDNEAILTNTEGTGGVRDPYLIRSYEGDHFYLIGTDLDANGGDWGAYGNEGSLSIVIWESDDLVNWSEVRLIEIAPSNAGCMWAPEATYDPETGEYVVYFASNMSNGKKIFYVKTRDFYHFTKPVIYKDVKGGTTFIDTTMTYYDGVYYRFTKNENNISILLETSDAVLGDYTLVKEEIAGLFGVEGPSIYKIEGEEKWVLYVDGYAYDYWGVGYFPLIADSLEDLKAGNFRKMSAGEFEMPPGAKHGSFMPITQAEYDALIAAYNK